MILSMSVFAQTEYTFTSYYNVVNNGYNFWISTPDDYAEKKSEMPVILFLHGHSLCGTDLNRVRKYGCLDAISMGRDIDALIIAPQNPGSPWNPDKLMNVLQWVQDRFEMDTDRIYVIGMSQGGYGTFDLVSKYPDKFAAAMALCGGKSRGDVCGLNTLPFWIMHGTADKAVPLSQSQVVVDAMKKCGSTKLLRFDKIPGYNHSQLAKVFYVPETYQWLLSHNRKERKLNKDIDITVTTLGKAYQDIDRSANKITVKSGHGSAPAPSISQDANKSDGGNKSAVTTNDSLAKVANEVVQEKPKTTRTDKKPTVHVVKKGDTLYAIAKKYHTTVEKLCRLNHIKETSILSLGQKIKVR
jgi:Predicted peptidase